MAATRIEHSLMIDRPVCGVFAFMEKAENMPRWAENVIEAAQTSEGPVGIGTTCQVTNKAMGYTFVQDFVVTEYERDSVYAARTTAGPFPLSTRYDLSEEDGATRVHVVSEADLSKFGGLAGPFIHKMAQKQIETDHARLKKLLEREG